MARKRVLAIGLDGFDISFANGLMAQGMLPVLAARREHDAHLLLDQGAAKRTGLGWEHFWSGLTPEAAHRPSPTEFNPSTYEAWIEGARFPPFFAGLDIKTVVLDAPYADLTRAPGVEGMVSWGTHDSGLTGTTTSPAGLLGELTARVGPYPASEWMYASPWPSPEATRAAGVGLEAGITARGAAARWLLGERIPEWDLALVVLSEHHSGAEAFWHGVDPTHPLHHHPSAEPAAEALTSLYRATDRFVGELIDSVNASSVVVFSLGGMGTNSSDVPSMVLLPELLLRWSLDERLLDIPPEWSAAPTQAPVVPEGRPSWDRGWYPQEANGASRVDLRSLADHLPGPARRWLRQVRSSRRGRARPEGYQSVDWMPISRYRARWPEMRAFALPALYDGRIRVNVRDREAAGLVAVSDYERVVNELEDLIRSCVDPRTGESVVETIEQPGHGDPLSVGTADADLVIEWRASTLAFDHPTLGLIGPVPYRRTGGHTGPYGFASVTGADVTPGDYGVASSFDVAPTIVDLVSDRSVDGISGISFLDAMRGAPSVR